METGRTWLEAETLSAQGALPLQEMPPQDGPTKFHVVTRRPFCLQLAAQQPARRGAQRTPTADHQELAPGAQAKKAARAAATGQPEKNRMVELERQLAERTRLADELDDQ